MKREQGRKLLVIALIIALSLGNLSMAYAKEKEFRVIGYYSGGLFNEPVENLQIDKLTHVMYAFLIPKEDGSLEPLEDPEQLKELVEKCHESGTKVYIALGGWCYQGAELVYVFEDLAASKESRTTLIDNVMAFVEEYDLDGVEIDWEHPNAKSIGNYESLVVEMSGKLEADGKHLTAALNGAWSKTEGPEVSKLLTDKCLDSFEFINIMAYDMNNEDHSPLWFANSSIEYWLNRKVPREKIIIGMPLYARPSWMQYRHIVQLNPENAYQDYAETAPLKSYYNGLNTLREKTMVALRKAGGVMLFDVNEDTLGGTSVVSMIDDTLNHTAGMSKSELQRHITVILDGRELVFDPKEGMGTSYIDGNNRTLVPLRKLLEAIGAEVTYEESTHEVTAVKDQVTVKAIIGEKQITVNGKDVPLDTKAVIKDNRTYLPLRAVLESFGYHVIWHDVSHTVYLDKIK